MTPSTYFRELVEPTIAEFEANPAGVRHAYAASVFAYHFADAVHVHTGRSKTQVRKELAAVEGIATVAKHLEATRTTVRPRVEDTHIGLGEKVIWTDAAGNVADRTDATGEVAIWHQGVVYTKDEHGNPVDVRGCVRATRRAIERYLAREGLP